GLAWIQGERAGVTRIIPIGVDGTGLQLRWRPRRLKAEVPIIGTALADLVDHSTDGAPVFGAIASGEGLLLLDRPIRQADSALARKRVGGVHAVEVIRVLRNR